MKSTRDDKREDPKGTTRRDFLKASVAGAAALGGVAAVPRAYAGGDDTIKVGMIGCGGRCAGAAMQALNSGPDVKLVAMYDIFDDRLQGARGGLTQNKPEQVEVDDDHCFTDFDGYARVIEASDVVVIACASKFHPMYSEAAIQADTHVFVEKPHGIDPVGVRRMKAACDLAQEKGISLLSGLQSRYHLGWQETVKRIHDGIIGDVTSIQSMFLRGPYRVVGRDAALSETQYQFSNWYHFCWLSGDDVPQSLVHNMDRVSWILKEEMPTWCFGLGGRSSSFGEVYGDMFDHHTVVYEYDSGARVYAMCRTQNGCYGNASDIVTGTKGTCYLGACRVEGETNWRYEGPQADPYQGEINALIESVRTGEPINSGYHMIGSTMLTVVGQVACYTGKETKYDDVAASDLEYGPSPDESSFDTPPPSVPDETGNYPLPMPGITELV